MVTEPSTRIVGALSFTSRLARWTMDRLNPGPQTRRVAQRPNGPDLLRAASITVRPEMVQVLAPCGQPRLVHWTEVRARPSGRSR